MSIFHYPTVSYRCEIGTTPARLVSPTVGLIPTTELELEGHKIDPYVSVPNVTIAIFAATDVAEPVLDPHGSADLRYGSYMEPTPQYVIVYQYLHF